MLLLMQDYGLVRSFNRLYNRSISGETDIFMQQKKDLLKQIPQIDKLMQNKHILECKIYRHELTAAARDVISELRDTLQSGVVDRVSDDDELAQKIIELADKRANTRKRIKRVINGTGVILHSNLGRASLSKAAAQAVVETASSYCTLEYDVDTGKRGNRTQGIEEYLRALTGCESSIIVNNNAAAVLLILSAIANGGNVLVSRGELVEIGGGFRVPDIITQCGCSLREVGTTNKTRLSDYEAGVDKDTKAVLKVHSSNFKIIGFTESVSINELAKLGKKYDIPVIEDIGSGALTDVRRYGLNDEPLAKESLKNGADIVSFSGDKLLGGLQCGIILGSEIYITALKKHPLYRAFRVDKMTIAALEATLQVYADPRAAERDIPVLSMLSLSKNDLFKRAENLCNEIRKNGGLAEVVKVKSVAGGGAVPGLELESYAITPQDSGILSAEKIDNHLRKLPVPVIGRIEDDRYLLDLRTMFEEDYEYIAGVFAKITAIH